MALVIVGGLVTACALAYQAFYTLRTGHTMLFLLKPARTHAPSRATLRIAYTLLYLSPAVAIAVILAVALKKAGVKRVQIWVMGNFGMIFWSLYFLLMGFLFAVQPEKMMRWMMRANPQLVDNRSIVIVARLVGVGLMGMGLVFLAKL